MLTYRWGFLRREEASFLSFKVGWGKHGVRVWDIPDTGKRLIQISVFFTSQL